MSAPLTKVLFVDDDDDMIMLAKYCLKSLEGVEVKYLTSGEEAIQEAPKFLPDLIVLDVMMPRMDGLQTLKILRDMPAFVKTPVIFLTAKAQKHEIEDYLKQGVLDVITKPYDALTLGNTLKSLWNRHLSESVNLL